MLLVYELDTASFEEKGTVHLHSLQQTTASCFMVQMCYAVQCSVKEVTPSSRLVPPYTTQHTTSLNYHRLSVQCSVQGLVLHSTTHYCSIVKYINEQWSVMQCNWVERNAVQWSATHWNALQDSEVKCASKCTKQNISASYWGGSTVTFSAVRRQICFLNAGKHIQVFITTLR